MIQSRCSTAAPIWAVLLVAGAACDTSSNSPTSDITLRVDGQRREAGADVSPDASEPYDKLRELTYQGRQRSYRLHVPTSYSASKPAPLLVALHGYSSSHVFTDLYGITAKADKEGFILVVPDGLPDAKAAACWNSGMGCTDRDDVGFIKAVLQEVKGEYQIDAARVFAVGFSNGGEMANRLGCELADDIVAVGSVAGNLLTSTCSPSKAVSIALLHGKEDPMVPYNGGPDALIPEIINPAAPDNASAWAKRLACKETPETTFTKNASSCITYRQCKDSTEVTFCTLSPLEHAWPAEPRNDLSATDYTWDYFVARPRK